MRLDNSYLPVTQPPSTTGLRYEDLLNEEEKEVKEALSLADPDVLTARNRRLKRAIDLSYKKKSLQVSWNDLHCLKSEAARI